MAVKFLLTGVERSGKTTITSKVKDGFIFSFDTKKYPFKVPHVNIPEFTGFDDLEDLINNKIVQYEEKMGKYPETIVFDTVTSLYTMITEWANNRFNGFDIHSAINKATLAFNSYIEKTLIANGINVVIIAHTILDIETKKYIVPASGAFAKSGSWLGAVDEASYVEIKSNKFLIHHTNLKFPCRSTLEGIEESQHVEEYDINEHIKALRDKHNHNEEFDFS